MHFFNSTLYLLVVKSKDSQSRVCDPSGDPRNKVMISAMRLTRTESRDPVDCITRNVTKLGKIWIHKLKVCQYA